MFEIWIDLWPFVFSAALNITQLHQIQLIVRDIDVRLDYLILGDAGHQKYKEECERIAEELQRQQYFHESRLFAEIVQLHDLDITVKEVNCETKYCFF